MNSEPKAGIAERQGVEANPRHLWLLSSTARTLLTSDDPRTFLDQVYEPLADLLGVDYYCHYVLEGKELLRPVVRRGVPAETPALTQLAFGQSVSGTVAAEQKPIILEDIQNRSDEMTRRPREVGITALASHPLVGRGRLIGVLTFGSRTRTRFDDDEIGLIRSISDLMAVAIERRHAEQALLAARDELEQRVRSRTQELERSREQLRELSQSLQATLEEERARIAREIHDELGSLLTSIKIELSVYASEMVDLQPARAKQIVRILASLDNSIHTVRRIATTLRPSLLDYMGLGAAIEWLANDFQEANRIPCQTQLDAPDGEPVLSVEQSTALFRIVQESLTNVARHARAGKSGITFRARQEELAIEVRDDGVGITETQLGHMRSWGITGMQERARAIGAELRISGVPGEGTTLVVRLPLERRHEEQGPHPVCLPNTS
jgi:signal transduction histidine kinase